MLPSVWVLLSFYFSIILNILFISIIMLNIIHYEVLYATTKKTI